MSLGVLSSRNHRLSLTTEPAAEDCFIIAELTGAENTDERVMINMRTSVDELPRMGKTRVFRSIFYIHSETSIYFLKFEYYL